MQLLTKQLNLVKPAQNLSSGSGEPGKGSASTSSTSAATKQKASSTATVAPQQNPVAPPQAASEGSAKAATIVSSSASAATTLTTTQLVNASGGANVYANTVSLSPLWTVQLLLLAAVLGMVGVVLVEGSVLSNLYSWLARIIGVKAPMPEVSHI